MYYHQQQPNRATCFLTALGILWGIPISELIVLIGHDGTEVLWPELRKSYCYRGHNIDEVMWLSYLVEKPIRLLNRVSQIGHDESDVVEVATPYAWDVLVHRPVGKILLNDGHAVVYDGSYVYDPSRVDKSQLLITPSDWSIIIL